MAASRAWLVSSAILSACVGFSSHAAAQDMTFGEAEYNARCAACHGPEGKGDGPIAILMKRPPRDLTRLAAENDGHFPVSEVYQAIDGRREIQGHGTREMPIWGDYFREQAGPKTFHPGVEVEEIVQGRILSLVYHLQSIQER